MYYNFNGFLFLYIYIYIYTHTHTHTYIYIAILYNAVTWPMWKIRTFCPLRFRFEQVLLYNTLRGVGEILTCYE
jgi:hypothetical protein